MESSGQLLGELLVSTGIIGPQDLATALARQGQTGSRLGEVLIEEGLLGEEALRWALARQLDIPLIHPDPKALAPEALELLPVELCRRYGVLPISLLPEEEGGAPVLTVAAADPADRAVLDDARQRVPYRVHVVAALREEILRCLDKLFGVAAEADLDGGHSEGFDGDLARALGDATGASLLAYLVDAIVESGARSLYLSSRQSKTYAHDGAGRELFCGGRDWLAVLLERIRKLASMTSAAGGVAQSGRLLLRTAGHDDTGVLLRVVILKGVSGEEAQLRVLEWEIRGRSLEDLGLTAEQAAAVRGSLSAVPGLTLVSAPSEEGVSSTLYALMREGSPTGRAVTIEEEVVYRSSDVLQLELPPHEEGLAELLRSLKMLDFRRVLLGKASRSRIGDLLPLARRGKAVFAGVEELTLRQTLEGLADYATRAPLHGLTLLVHMRLIRTLCPACRRSTAVRFPLEALKNATLYVRGPGCPECRDGFVGAMAFFEVLTIDRILREALEREGVGAEDVRRALQQIDNATRDRLAQAAADGRVSAAELSDYL